MELTFAKERDSNFELLKLEYKRDASTHFLLTVCYFGTLIAICVVIVILKEVLKAPVKIQYGDSKVECTNFAIVFIFFAYIALYSPMLKLFSKARKTNE